MRTAIQKKQIVKSSGNEISRPRKYSKAFIEINDEIKLTKTEEDFGNPFCEKILDAETCFLSQESKSKWTLTVKHAEKTYKLKPSKETDPVLVDRILEILQAKKIEFLKKSAEEAESLIKSQVKNQLQKRQHELEVLVPIAENLERDSEKFEKTTKIVKQKKKHPFLFKIKRALLCGYPKEGFGRRAEKNEEEDIDKAFESFRRKTIATAASFASPIK